MGEKDCRVFILLKPSFGEWNCEKIPATAGGVAGF